MHTMVSNVPNKQNLERYAASYWFQWGLFPKSIETILISRIYFEDFIIIFQTEF